VGEYGEDDGGKVGGIYYHEDKEFRIDGPRNDTKFPHVKYNHMSLHVPASSTCTCSGPGGPLPWQFACCRRMFHSPTPLPTEPFTALPRPLCIGLLLLVVSR